MESLSVRKETRNITHLIFPLQLPYINPYFYFQKAPPFANFLFSVPLLLTIQFWVNLENNRSYFLNYSTVARRKCLC